MSVIDTILLVLTVVFLVLGAFNVGSPRVRLEWIGAACAVLTLLV